MVSGKTEINSRIIRFSRSDNFVLIPPALVSLIEGIDLESYGNNIDFMNRAYWNLLARDGNEVVGAAWGFFCPVDKLFVVLRIVVTSEYQHTLLAHAMLDEIFTFGEDIGASRVITASDKHKPLLRLFNNKVVLSEARVIERML